MRVRGINTIGVCCLQTACNSSGGGRVQRGQVSGNTIVLFPAALRISSHYEPTRPLRVGSYFSTLSGVGTGSGCQPV